MDFYEFMEECKAKELSASEAINEWEIACEENNARLVEEYENDPMTWEGWHQQDMIDLRYRER